MDKLLVAIQAFIERHDMFTRRDLIVVALSGGVDSVALLLSLHALGYRLHAYHLNHGLRGLEADEDAAFCRLLCERLGIPITLDWKDVAHLAESKSISFETMGRRLRYEGLAEIVRAAQVEKSSELSCISKESYGFQGRAVVVTGHHAWDAAETFVMNVLRGAGLDGLTSIQPVTERIVEQRNVETGFYQPPVRFRIARPLLFLSKTELEVYVQEAGESWREDATNTDLHYLRNRIRHMLREEDVKMIGRTIALVSEDRAYIESQIDALESQYLREYSSEEVGAGIRGSERRTSVEVEKSCVLLALDGNPPLHPVEFARLVRRAVRKVSGHIVDLSKKDVEAILRLERTGAVLEVAGRVQVYRSYEGLEFRCSRNLLRNLYQEETSVRRRKAWKNSDLLGETESYRVWGERIRVEDLGTRTKKSEETSFGWVYYFDADKVVGTLSVRTREPGDRLIPLGMKGYKKVKDVLIDAKVDARVRDQLALVQDEVKLCLIGGVRLSEEVKMTRDTKNLWKVMVERKYL